MARLEVALALVTVAVAVAALVNLVLTPKAEVKYVPKWGWALGIVLFPALGGLIWFLFGKDRSNRPAPQPRAMRAPRRGAAPAAPPPPLPREAGRYSSYDADDRIRQIEQELAALERETQEDLRRKRQDRGDQQPT